MQVETEAELLVISFSSHMLMLQSFRIYLQNCLPRSKIKDTSQEQEKDHVKAADSVLRSSVFHVWCFVFFLCGHNNQFSS